MDVISIMCVFLPLRGCACESVSIENHLNGEIRIPRCRHYFSHHELLLFFFYLPIGVRNDMAIYIYASHLRHSFSLAESRISRQWVRRNECPTHLLHIYLARLLHLPDIYYLICAMTTHWHIATENLLCAFSSRVPLMSICVCRNRSTFTNTLLCQM